MHDQLTFTGHLTAYSCWCGLRFAMPDSLYRWHRETTDHTVYCPLGHSMVASRSETARLRAKLDQAETDARVQREEREAAERRMAAAKAEVDRTRKRAAAGACPCCNRTFVQLARHIATKHPDFLGVPEVDDRVRWANLTWSVAEIVRVAAGEPLTPAMVLGRLALAGRRSSDTERTVMNALYNAERSHGIRRVAPKTWAA